MSGEALQVVALRKTALSGSFAVCANRHWEFSPPESNGGFLFDPSSFDAGMQNHRLTFSARDIETLKYTIVSNDVFRLVLDPAVKIVSRTPCKVFN
jgi:hypothetical protein